MDLAYDNPVAELGPGDLFGEMTCMSFYPRSATVRAETDCTMLEMLRNVLDILQRNKTFRAQMDETYRRRALELHLRNVPLFAIAQPGIPRSSARPRRTGALCSRADRFAARANPPTAFIWCASVS